jgi:hypothetical protein
MDYGQIKLLAGVLATIGLYSVLYKENKFYRFFEHIFLGLAAGWAIVALWAETLKEKWWDQMVGRAPDAPGAVAGGEPGYWLFALLLPVGLMGYFVFSKRHAWMSRIPIGIILGLWSGQQLQVWWTRYGPQIKSSVQPIVPTTWESWTVPVAPAEATVDQIAAVDAIRAANVFPSQAITNLIALITVLSVLSYFLFSFDFKSRFMLGWTKMGRYLLMVGFGAIFGSTVMMRFSLLIDRMYFIWIEGLRNTIFGGGIG